MKMAVFFDAVWARLGCMYESSIFSGVYLTHPTDFQTLFKVQMMFVTRALTAQVFKIFQFRSDCKQTKHHSKLKQEDGDMES